MNLTPEQQQELWDDLQARKIQQIRFPLDEASKNAIEAAMGRGAGSATLTQVITIGAGGGSATVPSNPAGSVIIEMNGVRYVIPYLTTI